MPETAMMQWLATMGVGGVLAGFMFMFYRKDVKQYTDLWKAQAELNRVQTELMIGVVKDNTASNARLIALIENQERNMFRKDDLFELMDHKLRERDRQHGHPPKP